MIVLCCIDQDTRPSNEVDLDWEEERLKTLREEFGRKIRHLRAQESSG